MKVRLFDDREGVERIWWMRSVAFLALALRRLRHLAKEERAFRDIYGDAKWSLHLGVPSCLDKTPFFADYEKMARVAWSLSGSSEASIHLAEVEARWMEHPTATGGDFCVVPEFAGEVVTYARAPERRDDLHFVLDVGASSLDFCSFVLRDRPDEGDLFQILTGDVLPRGVFSLHRHRLRSAPAPNPRVIQMGPSDRLPDAASDYGCSNDVDDRFVVECVNGIMRAISLVKRQRYPQANSWGQTLSVFKCGGGIEHPIFRRVMKEVEGRVLKAKWADEVRFRSLPRPSSFQGVREEDFHRLAVAHGLSFDVIGDVRAAYAAEDLGPAPRAVAADFVSKDQV